MVLHLQHGGAAPLAGAHRAAKVHVAPYGGDNSYREAVMSNPSKPRQFTAEEAREILEASLAYYSAEPVPTKDEVQEAPASWFPYYEAA